MDEGTLFDPLYGTGFDRALRVARAADIPESDWPPPLVAYAKAQEGLRANGTSLILRVQSGYTNAAQMVICVDRQPIGVLSNVDGKGRLELPMLVPGPHLIQALQVWLYQTLNHLRREVRGCAQVAGGMRIRFNRKAHNRDRTPL